MSCYDEYFDRPDCKARRSKYLQKVIPTVIKISVATELFLYFYTILKFKFRLCASIYRFN